MADVARFLEAIRYDGSAASVLGGMRASSPIAADGYAQNYGTSVISGIEGTKFAWPDDHTVNGSASIGPGYSVAAMTFGSADDLTSDVLASVHVLPAEAEDTILAGVYRSRLSCHLPQTSSEGLWHYLDASAATVTVPAEVLTVLPHC